MYCVPQVLMLEAKLMVGYNLISFSEVLDA